MTDPLDDPAASAWGLFKRASLFTGKALRQGARDIWTFIRWFSPRARRALVVLAESTQQGVQHLNCPACGGQGTMIKTIHVERNLVSQLFGCAIFLAALVIGLATLLTLIGPIICGIIALASLFMGYRRTKVWKCVNCNSISTRA